MTELNPLTVAMQMDPMEGIKIGGDSTFHIMLAAQARGHRLYHYLAPDLTFQGGRVWAMARPVKVQKQEGDHFAYGDWEVLDLGRDVDVVWMRQDPPFDLSYITATHLLERVQAETLVVNDPASVRNAPEKLFVLDYARFMPPTMITRSLSATRKFLEEHGEIVVKPLYGNGGVAVFHVDSKGSNLSSLVELFKASWVEPFMVQAFIPGVAQGDKRIVLIDGEVAGAVNRIPGKGEIRSNLAVGGSAAKTELTDKEREICAAMGPELKARGLLFVGIDVIGGEWLTEINVTSPTGLVSIDAFDGIDTGGMIWDAIDARLAARVAG
ncbi:glutathione synthase [Sphingobium sp. CR2-8]|uniref:glutathione synthase n=1 Tax=Sphingobium sp. CR2-8 TaxID=1306534 RepID=UPI002DB5C920|nr:glutathione synthase [Sphingobium sp. CR2-8]MEC3912244.1 glutathione synthase [Sphingobium sp. CR2-8]